MIEVDKPIPGQSLTATPQKFPYERPPEISDPEEAIQMHLSRLDDEDRQQAIVDMIELDPEEMDIKTITAGLLRSAVATGIHTLDTSLIIAPVVHERIKQIAVSAGLDVEDGIEDYKSISKDRKKITKEKLKSEVDRVLNSEEIPMEEPEEEIEETSQVETEGLISRRVK